MPSLTEPAPTAHENIKKSKKLSPPKKETFKLTFFLAKLLPSEWNFYHRLISQEDESEKNLCRACLCDFTRSEMLVIGFFLRSAPWLAGGNRLGLISAEVWGRRAWSKILYRHKLPLRKVPQASALWRNLFSFSSFCSIPLAFMTNIANTRCTGRFHILAGRTFFIFIRRLKKDAYCHNDETFRFYHLQICHSPSRSPFFCSARPGKERPEKKARGKLLNPFL